VDEGGSVRAWVPGGGGAREPGSTGALARELDTIARRPAIEEASTAQLVAVARIEERLGHDPRAEWVEVWTRALLPCALVLVLAACAVSVRRGHGPLRAAVRLVVVFAVGWLCLAASTQLFLNGIVPGWAMLAVPTAALGIVALL
jgi:lipopolysaccharide export LptBFGC system permease protein LptF